MLLYWSTRKRFGSVGGFWTGLRGSLVVAYCIPWAFLPRVMCGHRDGPWGLHNNSVTFPKFKHQAVIFASDFFTLYDKEFKLPVNHWLPHGKVLLYWQKNFWECCQWEKKSPRDDIMVVLCRLVLFTCTDWCWCGDVARAEPPPQDLVNACA